MKKYETIRTRFYEAFFENPFPENNSDNISLGGPDWIPKAPSIA